MRGPYVVAVFATFSLLLIPEAEPAGSVGYSTPEHALLAEINRVRAGHGLAPLRFDARLQRAARSHSADMLRDDYFAHRAFASRLLRFGAQGPVLGENLAWGVGEKGRARSIVAMWLASPGHRRNVLRPGFRRVGVASLAGEFRGYRGARVVTADFAGT